MDCFTAFAMTSPLIHCEAAGRGSLRASLRGRRPWQSQGVIARSEPTWQTMININNFHFDHPVTA